MAPPVTGLPLYETVPLIELLDAPVSRHPATPSSVRLTQTLKNLLMSRPQKI
jgi:hypothetical protein